MTLSQMRQQLASAVNNSRQDSDLYPHIYVQGFWHGIAKGVAKFDTRTWRQMTQIIQTLTDREYGRK